MNKTIDEDIQNFHIPRWNEIPNVDLYIDQVVCFLQDSLCNYIKNDNEKDDKIITKTMINNYVKQGIIKPPLNKKYNKEHISYLFVIFILKQLYSINDIKKLINLAISTSSPEQAYNKFCSELEKSIKLTFSGENYLKSDTFTNEQYLLKNVVQSFSNKLFVQRTFLNFPQFN